MYRMERQRRSGDCEYCVGVICERVWLRCRWGLLFVAANKAS